ncbi:hypothetical protein [Ralstonia flatus]|uniref:Uncharacterized protein n=1 Tax=Ralstonia flatus TaxID=3058601 RepID=A0AAD2BZT1_9RALS|nr:hypothetical protein [Ralstonia sp. LMG 32965]CAJ0861131.1 hypothetical protein R77567_01522 [Ralstonia sp. LMG 32965]CAJ0869198.1 hypothetical protein R77564_01539 [Ralstonia sp. LMG 32965]
MPIFAQRCARRLPFGWTVEKTGVAANRTAMVVMRPASGVDGDFIMQRVITLLIALRSVLADTLPARLAFGVIPTRAFDPSTDSVMSALTDGELSTSHAWLNNPTATGLAQSPRKRVCVHIGPLPCRIPHAATVFGRSRYALRDAARTRMWRFRNVRRTPCRYSCSTVSCSVPRRALFSLPLSSSGVTMQANLTAFAALAPPLYWRPQFNPVH